ncbi:MAG TPA: hypothetical protein VJ978_14500, partial [Nitriliruptoraceae bacterium]|nr:hypothetical protein [Nitriliruptoraceae bacterium]
METPPPAFTLLEVDDPAIVPTGDMPGDRVEIGDGHVARARTIAPRLWELLWPILADDGRAVVAVHGGSGVGKSEIGSLLAHHLRGNGVGAYVMSGDNYPRRIPSDNDAERLRVFRAGGLGALVDGGIYDADVRSSLAELQAADVDADPARRDDHAWLAIYQQGGRAALQSYLGTPRETDFDEVNRIIAAFKEGDDDVLLKRMGRERDELWYEAVDMRDVQVLVIEWTHGNNDFVEGVDIPILLNSTPAETLAHRRSRARDKGVDAPFTTMVLELEQQLLVSQAHRARIIATLGGDLIDHDTFLREMGAHLPEHGPMLNAYPDSIGGDLGGLTTLLTDPAVRGSFTSAYVLPSVFHSDLDRGFSVIDYDLDRRVATAEDLAALGEAGVALKFDFVLNHASVLSPQFQDLVANGQRSAHRDFFIDWNSFWEGHGDMTDQGWVQPDPDLVADMHFRKPGLPILMVRMPDGTERPYWNTFYQQVQYPIVDAQDLMAAGGLQYSSAALLADRVNDTLAGDGDPHEIDFTGFEHVRGNVVDWLEDRRSYLGQMDLDVSSPLVWEYYAETLDRLAGYGAEIVRLDAFAYAHKAPGRRNFFNEPETWDLLDRVKHLATARGLKLLPEIHARHEEGIHEQISERGFVTYDFFLPGLVIDALANADASHLRRWIHELVDRRIRVVNMLGCHDGIPLLDLGGLLSDTRIDDLIELVKARGGHVKDLHGNTKLYYQVNATYHSALGESDDALLLARAIQLFMPGKPQVWYLDLFAGRNDL